VADDVLECNIVLTGTPPADVALGPNRNWVR